MISLVVIEWLSSLCSCRTLRRYRSFSFWSGIHSKHPFILQSWLYILFPAILENIKSEISQNTKKPIIFDLSQKQSTLYTMSYPVFFFLLIYRLSQIKLPYNCCGAQSKQFIYSLRKFNVCIFAWKNSRAETHISFSLWNCINFVFFAHIAL